MPAARAAGFVAAAYPTTRVQPIMQTLTRNSQRFCLQLGTTVGNLHLVTSEWMNRSLSERSRRGLSSRSPALSLIYQTTSTAWFCLPERQTAPILAESVSQQLQQFLFGNRKRARSSWEKRDGKRLCSGRIPPEHRKGTEGTS